MEKAVRGGGVDTVKFLMSKGCSLDNFSQLVDWAYKYGRDEMVEFLASIDPNYDDNNDYYLDQLFEFADDFDNIIENFIEPTNSNKHNRDEDNEDNSNKFQKI
jgi:hypothetical protein